MKYIFIQTLFLITFSLYSFAQTRNIEVESSITTNHFVTVKGMKIPYSATAGTLPVWSDEDKAVATLFYTYYKRTDLKNNENRPLFISFNGGPGAASIWMNMGYTSPRILNIDDEGNPIQPYGISENPHSIIDVADIVFVNPVNVGLSRILDKDYDRSNFFGVNSDIKYLAQWIEDFINKYNRWTSPKYLIGESYGTTRCSGLALQLQNRNHTTYLNGVILVSPTGLGIDRDGPVAAALSLPYYSVTAKYHNQLNEELQNKDIESLLDEVESFTINEFLPAIALGNSISKEKKFEIAEKAGRYSGLKTKDYLDNNLNVSESYYWKKLLYDEGLTIGRLDSRYRGIDKSDAGTSYDYDPAMAAWDHSFTPAMQYYLKNELNYQTNMNYNVWGNVRPWDRSNDRTGENLRQAMAKNPYLHVFIQSGYYDGATDYFNAKYTMWHLDPSGKMKDRLSHKSYESGHMMYLRREDLKNSNEDIRNFIIKTTPKSSAKY
ncbi:MAG: carboxypeptidase [Cytophagales bacterium]|nr:carboxypeptidase [Cytophagales bacterium]